MVRIWFCVLPLATWFETPRAVNIRRHSLDQSVAFCANENQRCCSPDWAKKSSIPHRVHPPRMVFTHGCAGSSQIMAMTKKFMDIFHARVVDCHGGYEVMADIAKGYYNMTDMNVTLREFVRRAGLQNRSLLFKGELVYARDQEASMKYLSNMGTKAVVVHRSNALDTALCAVHDNFVHFTSKRFGRLVDDQWREMNASFRSRSSSAVNGTKPNVLVDVNTSVMLSNLRQITNYQDANVKFLEDHGYPMDNDHVYDAEDLFAYNKGLGGLYKSARAWKNFLSALGVKAQYPKVIKYLKSQMGSHEPPKKHSELIINFGAVKKALDECEIPAKLMQDGEHFRTVDWCLKAKGMLRI